MLPGLDIDDDDQGEVFIRLPLSARSLPTHLKDLFEALMVRYRDKDTPILVSNERLAAELKCSVGNVRRNLAILKERLVPGKTHAFIRIDFAGPTREIYILARPKSARNRGVESPPVEAPARRVPKGARLEIHKSLAESEVASSALFFECKETSNVNVGSIGEENPPHAHAREIAGPVETPDPPAPPTIPAPVIPAAAPPADGIDPMLAGMTADQLRIRIAELEPLTRSPAILVRIQANMDRTAARSFLDALEGRGEPASTPKVESIAPKPAAAPAATPRPTVQGLADRLRRTAGPEPIETFARRLAEELNDPGSLAFYRKLADEVRRGDVDPRRIWDGVRKARSAGVKSPGAIFTAFVRRLE